MANTDILLYRTKKMSYNLSNHVFEQKQTMLIWLGSIIKSWSRLGVSFGNQPRHFSSDQASIIPDSTHVDPQAFRTQKRLRDIIWLCCFSKLCLLNMIASTGHFCVCQRKGQEDIPFVLSGCRNQFMGGIVWCMCSIPLNQNLFPDIVTLLPSFLYFVGG